MDAEMEFRGDYPVAALPALAANHWYLGFACNGCKRLFGVLDEPTQSGTLKTGGSATFQVSCPHCGEAATFSADQLRVFRAPSARSTVIDEAAPPPPGEANG